MTAMLTKRPEGSASFLDLVDFKWLMAGVGWWVDLSRLQRDGAYMDECLQRALGSGSWLLRKRSMELLGLQSGPDTHHDTAMPRAFTDQSCDGHRNRITVPRGTGEE
jgi:hypothetical protein